MRIQKSHNITPTRAIRLPEVVRITGMSRASVWRRVNDDASFPKPFKVGPQITVWNEAAVLDWLALKQRASEAA